MNVELKSYEKSFNFNISPFMPISYLKKLACKSFNIPNDQIILSHKEIKIEKQYNDTILKDYFPNTLKILINVSKKDIKSNFRLFLNSSTSSLKEIKLTKLISENKIISNKKFKSFNLSKSIEPSKFEKCEVCNNNDVEYFCREDKNFLCSNCKKEAHNNHKSLNIEKGNIENCGYLYKKILIENIDNEEVKSHELIEKDNNENILNDKIEYLYDIISQILKQLRDILCVYPCAPIAKIENIDWKNIRKYIFSIENKNQSNNSYSLKDKKSYFNELQEQDLIIENIKKDIESIKKKFLIQDLFVEIIDKLNENLEGFSTSIDSLKNKKSLSEFPNHIDNFIENQRRIFHLDKEEEEKEEKVKECADIEKVYFKNKLNKFNYLPSIKNMYNSSYSKRNIPILKNYYTISANKLINKTINKTNSNIHNIDVSSSSSSDSSYNGIIEKTIKKNKNKINANNISHKNTIDRSSRVNSNLKLNEVLLNENELNTKLPKRPKKKESVRLSIFIKNKVKVEDTTSQIMKIKKKKKKII